MTGFFFAKMINEFEKKVCDFIDKESLLNKNQNFILAYSGGADSTALLYVLKKLGYNFKAIHINHNLRGAQSQEDALFAADLCSRLNIPITVFSIDVKKNAQEQNISIELAARNLRLEKLITGAKSQKTDTVVTAHHINDNAETVIQRLMRGTGYRGLAGIKAQNSISQIRFVRPLLTVSKNQILQYLNDEKIDYRTDYTNFENIYTRNKIRNQLLPCITENSTNDIAESIFNLSKAAVKYNNLIQSKAGKYLHHIQNYFNFKLINKDIFINIQYPLKIELIRMILISLGLGEKDLNYDHYTSIAKIDKQGSYSINLPNGFFVKTNAKQIVFSKPPERNHKTINIGKTNTFEQFSIKAEILDFNNTGLQQLLKNKDNWTEYFDLEKINGNLVIRSIKNGDTFTPLGKNTPRKVSDFCPSKAVPVISDEENILWIASVRLSNICKITENTNKVLRVIILNQTKSDNP